MSSFMYACVGVWCMVVEGRSGRRREGCVCVASFQIYSIHSIQQFLFFFKKKASSSSSSTWWRAAAPTTSCPWPPPDPRPSWAMPPSVSILKTHGTIAIVFYGWDR